MAYQKYKDIPNRREPLAGRDHIQHIENALQGVVPGPGEVIVGSAGGPVAQPSSRPAYEARRPRVTRVVADMQPGHGWIKHSTAGTMADDTAVPMLGSQSVRVTAGSSTVTVLRKTDMTPVDATDKDIVVWLRADRPDLLSEALLYVSSDNMVGFATQKLDEQTSTWPYMRPNEWVPITLPASSFTPVGTVNWAALNALQIRFKSSSGTVTVHFGGIGLVERSPKPLVSITFDDGFSTQYSRAKAVLSRYGFRPTSYLIADVIGSPSFLTMAHLEILRDTYGWEFAAHAGTMAAHESPYPSMTEQEISDDFAQLREWLISHGFIEGADHLAYPRGAYDEKVLRQARKHFVSARTTKPTLQETYPAGDPHRLRALNVANTHTVSQLTAAIDQAIRDKSWLILVFHNIVNAGGATAATHYPVDWFEEVMAHLASTGVDVRTVGDVMRNGV